MHYKTKGEQIMNNIQTRLFRVFLLAGVVFFACLPAFASPMEELNLTDQQVVSIKTIIRQANNNAMQAASNLQSARALQIKDIMGEIKTIRNDALRNIRGQLDPNQQAVFDQWSVKRQQKNENKKEMLKSLNLTKRQKIQIVKISESSKEAAWRIVGDTSMTHSEIRKQLAQLRANTAQTIRQQLSPEQQVKFNAWQEQHTRDTF